MTQLGGPLAEPRLQNDGVTNGREVLAYTIAQVLKLVLIYALGFARVFNPLYVWALQSGGRIALYAVSAGLSVVWGSLALIVFFVARSLFEGIPANTPRGPEIILFALAYAVVTGVQLVLNAMVLGPLYLALGLSAAPLLGLTVSILSAALTFAAFLALRQAIRPGRSR
jgi:hypothetical protein